MTVARPVPVTVDGTHRTAWERIEQIASIGELADRLGVQGGEV
ncbi:hypothetical protein [Nocardia acidivorans]|nr:hypothetical protein [Nocardia acidivorans]